MLPISLLKVQEFHVEPSISAGSIWAFPGLMQWGCEEGQFQEKQHLKNEQDQWTHRPIDN